MQETASVDTIYDSLDSIDGAREAAAAVFGSGATTQHFRELVHDKQTAGVSGAADHLKLGLALFILSQFKPALEHLSKGNDNDVRAMYLGKVHRLLRQTDEAVKQFDIAQKKGVDEFTIACEKAQALREAGEYDKVEAILKPFSGSHADKPDYLYQLAALAQARGETQQAVELLDSALQRNPNHQASNFRLAQIYDLHGEEERALELYIRATETPPIHVNALLNLAVLYEDFGEYDEAIRCLQQVLSAHPAHERAILFLKDVEASYDMEYDEEAERNRSKRELILRTPISDFELSVRARNCLKKLNVETLGDLLKISESQLRQYKNFGETSLEEIRQMLNAHNLRLGQSLEEPTSSRRPLAALRRSQAAASTKGQNANDAILSKAVVELDLSVRSRKCLQRLNVATVGELVAKSEAELLATKNFGVTSLTEIKSRLAELGLSLRGGSV